MGEKKASYKMGAKATPIGPNSQGKEKIMLFIFIDR